MRDFKGMKRQRGRNRGGGGGQQGGGKPQHNINRAFDSQGPDNIKVRGNAQHVYEKYQALARDATSAGDRVLAENHLQHAEHYFRTLRAIQPNRAASEIVSRDSFTSGYDIDFEDEAVETAMEEADAQAAARAAEAQSQAVSAPGEGEAGAGGEAPRFDRDRNERREWRDRNDRPQGETRDRNDRDRNDRAFNGERQGQNGEFRDRGDRSRFRDRNGFERNGNGNGNDRNDDRFRDRAEPRVEGDARPRDDRPYEPRRDRFRDERRFEPREGEPSSDVAQPTAEPREEAAPVLRSEDGGVSQLPSFLQAPQATEGEGEARRRPRRRRSREDGDAPTTTEPEVEEV